MPRHSGRPRVIPALIFLLALGPPLRAAAPGLPFTEDFASTALRDAARTTADWDTASQALRLARRRPLFGAFGSGAVPMACPPIALLLCSDSSSRRRIRRTAST